MYFSPIRDTQVTDATVAYLELGGKQLVQIGDQRQRIASGSSGHEAHGSTLWIGLELGDGVDSLAGMRFYFNWLNAPNLPDKLEWLRWAKWSCGGHPLLTDARGEGIDAGAPHRHR